MDGPPAPGPEGRLGAVPKVYLPGLNGIRFVAASAVIFHHIEQGKETVGLPSLYTEAHPLVLKAGGLGVTLFFVLSGFLISYLLLTEIKVTGTVQIRNFYIRRVLRIWPLYFLIVLLAWVLLPTLQLFEFPLFRNPFGPDYLSRISFFLLLSPQLAFPRLVTPTLAGPLWSVGVEEHFYAFWPLLVRGFKGKILLPCLGVLLLFVFLRVDVRYAQRLWKEGDTAELLTYFKNVLYWTRFGCMAIGGIGAWLCLTHPARIRWLFRRDVQLLVMAGLASCLASGTSFRLIEHEFYSVFFVILIMNVSHNPASLLRLENPVFNFMGEISYGLYVYHWFVIVAVLNILGRMGGIGSPVLRNLVVYTLVGGVTTAVAALSYRLLERPFLRMKNSFAVILSGSAARPAPEHCRR
jgi:peptidoglycan/LPS O-acetylase OafA/YrhL